jgi:hypothetical protein
MEPYSYTKASPNMRLQSLYDLGQYFRKRRWQLFSEFVEEVKAKTFIDIGGRPDTWGQYIEIAPAPESVTIVNLPSELKPESHPWMRCVVGNGLSLPFPDKFFDVAFSNSVIEHLGTEANQKQFAAEASRVAKAYFIQTPNRHFPVEPHYLTPFIHWVPKALREHMIRNCTVWGWVERPTQEHCEGLIQELRLLSARELNRLFPGSVVRKEEVLGLVKSIIACSC